MAGRRPRSPRDGSPLAPSKSPKQLRPRRRPASGSWIDGEWVEAGKPNAGARDAGFRDGNRPGNAFDEDNDFSTVHGAHSEREIGPRALAFVTAMLEDGQSPDHLRSPAFRSAVLAWGRAEAVASLLFDWLALQDIDGLITPRLAATKAPVDTWRSLEAHAANLRSKLGIDPVSYARIAKDLGIAQKASEDALERLAGKGAEITSRRLELEGGDAPA